MEITKFWTKTKIIILIVFIAIIGLIVGLIFLNRARLKKEYIKLENRITNDSAPNYMRFEQIKLKENEYRKITLKEIRDDKLVGSRADDCDGYVIAENKSKLTFTTYLKCKSIYTTKGYGSESTMVKNETKTQSEEDTIKPSITLLGSKTMNIALNEKFKDPGATATDNIDGDLSKNVKVQGEVDTSLEGSYTLTYTVSDKSGNENSKKRTVIVSKEVENKKDNKDTIVPVITFKNETAYQKICIGEKVNIDKNGVYGYTAYDDVDKDITDNVKISGQIQTMRTVGEYVINYTVSDKAGNESSSSRKYSVINCSTPSNSTNSNNNTSNNSNTKNSSGGSSSSNYISNLPTETSTISGNTNQDINVQINVETNPTRVCAPDIIHISVNKSLLINASVLPSNATNKTLIYKVIDPNVASVDSNGIVKGLSKGETRVIITTFNGKSKGVNIIVE